MALHREDVVRAAIGLLDEVGLDGFTTRALTQRLGVQRGALYWHVRSKRELLGAIAGEIMAEAFAADPAAEGDGETVTAPIGAAGDGPGGDGAAGDGPGGVGGDGPGGAADGWVGPAASFAHRTRRAMLAHRDGARLVAGYLPMTDAILEATERGLALMRAAGLPLARAAYFGDTVASYVTGFVLQEQATPDAEPAGAEASPEGLDLNRYPNLRAWQAQRPADGDAAFAAGLSLIIGGLRAELNGPRAEPNGPRAEPNGPQVDPRAEPNGWQVDPRAEPNGPRAGRDES
jgi:TetR/AcrR family tetracycline transcriptional repressor